MSAEMSASGMHLKKRSRYASSGAKVRGAAEATLGTDLKGRNSMYDTRSGTLLTIVLLFVLGWIPMFGQMVTGFVAGRRAGSPLRGLIASLVGTAIVLAIMFFTVEGLNAINSAILADPEGAIADVIVTYPALKQVLDAFLLYARELFGSVDFQIDYLTYAITVPFGIIGGVFADQAQKEARIIIARTGRVNARSIRSIEAYKEGRTLGFETFEQYTAMSVNSMATPAKAATKREDAPVFENPKRTTVRAKESPVTATVDTTKVQSTTTSSMTARKDKEKDTEAIVYI